jgi:citrate lyase subunit beta / citryl-CoA lyase
VVSFPPAPRRLRRSCLIVPGTSNRMLEKARGLAADQVVLDLEDAVVPADKNDATRRLVADSLRRDWISPTTAVRVNAVGTDWFEDDIRRLIEWAGDRIQVIVLPKVESAGQIGVIDGLLDELGAQSIALEAQIETALGLTRVEEIAASSSKRLEALVFGAGDYAASLGIPQETIGGIDERYPGDQWHYPRSRIAVAAHANGLDAIDSPFASFRDEPGLCETARRARLLGFSGKWVIHPDQIEPVNRVFSPTSEEVEAARRLLAALDHAAGEGRGAAEHDGAMVDEASRRLAEAVVARVPT